MLLTLIYPLDSVQTLTSNRKHRADPVHWAQENMYFRALCCKAYSTYSSLSMHSPLCVRWSIELPLHWRMLWEPNFWRAALTAAALKTLWLFILPASPSLLLHEPGNIRTAALERLTVEKRGEIEKQGRLKSRAECQEPAQERRLCKGSLVPWQTRRSSSRRWVLTRSRNAFLSKSSVWTRARSATISLSSLLLCSMAFCSSVLSVQNRKIWSPTPVWPLTKLRRGLSRE